MALEPIGKAISKILSSEGFKVDEGDSRVVAKKGDLEIRILIPLKDADILEVITNLSEEKVGQEHLVVVTQEEPDEETTHIARTRGVVVWTSEDIEEERGISILRKFIKDPPSGLLKRIMEGEASPVSIDLGLTPKGAYVEGIVSEKFLPAHIDPVLFPAHQYPCC